MSKKQLVAQFGSGYVTMLRQLQKTDGRGPARKRRFAPVPIGSVVTRSWGPAPNIPEIAIPSQFHQGEEDTCAFTSFASAMYYAGLTEAATEIYELGRTTYLNVGTPLNSLMEHVRQMGLQFNVVKLKKDKKTLQFLLDSTSAGGDHTIYLVLLGCSDGTRNHAVSILNV